MRKSRLVIAAVILAAGIAAERGMSSAMARAAQAGTARLSFEEFPRVVGRWRAERGNLTERESELLRVDDYLRAEFYPPDGSSAVSAYVGYYGNPDRATQHPPTICYPGAGWLKAYEAPTRLKAGQSGEIEVQETVFQRGDERQLVVYWYQTPGYSGARTGRQKLVRLMRTLSGKAPAGAAKVQIALKIDTSREAAEKQLEGFLSDFLPELRRFVPQDASEGS